MRKCASSLNTGPKHDLKLNKLCIPSEASKPVQQKVEDRKMFVHRISLIDPPNSIIGILSFHKKIILKRKKTIQRSSRMLTELIIRFLHETME